MSRGAEGERFLAAFNQLKAATSNDPERLQSSWEEDAGLQKLCDEIATLVQGFERLEELSSYSFTPHVSSAAVKARRDYDDRWQSIVSHVANRKMAAIFEDLIRSLDLDAFKSDNRLVDALSDKISDWKSDADGGARSLDTLFDFAYERGESGEYDWINDSLSTWDRLTASGLDVQGVLWRRRAVPHVLVPAHVAKHYGRNRASLYRRLHQAGHAFVFGAPLAALALQRAVLEEVLKKHWGVEDGKIRNAELPDRSLSWNARADRLKRLGNDALHNDPEKLLGDKLDRAIIENFLVLRLLIEHAPDSAKGRS
tara:strand:+ start:15031 stop:15966 length:936 start_codon:yes stop_codon:yes gene_type:complete